MAGSPINYEWNTLILGVKVVVEDQNIVTVLLSKLTDSSFFMSSTIGLRISSIPNSITVVYFAKQSN